MAGPDVQALATMIEEAGGMFLIRNVFDLFGHI